MSKPFRNATCTQCDKDYSYKYTGGRTRKYCFTCKPSKKRNKRQSLNAYEQFDWGLAPVPWSYTGKGNIKYRYSPREILVLFVSSGYFGCTVLGIGPNPEHRNSAILARGENLLRAIDWAQKRFETIEESYKAS